MGVLTSRPGAFFVIAVYALLWILLSPDTFEWHAAATLATWLMTVFIQRAEHRDTQAIHAKLDHLLERLEPANGSLARLDRMQPEDIEKFRKTHSPVRPRQRFGRCDGQHSSFRAVAAAISPPCLSNGVSGMRGLEDKSFLLLLVAVSLAFAWILWPLSGAILWGTVFAIVFAPLYRRLLRSTRQRRNIGRGDSRYRAV